MARFPEADARLFNDMYICMKCNARNRIDKRRIRLGKGSCRTCGSDALRPKRRDH
ncbi:MAG: 50S ribosomal protein L40e [archaeon]